MDGDCPIHVGVQCGLSGHDCCSGSHSRAEASEVQQPGLPRRQVLLLGKHSDRFLAVLKGDSELYDKLLTSTFDGSEQMKNRHVFRKVANVQLLGCLDVEGWHATDRLSATTIERYS